MGKKGKVKVSLTAKCSRCNVIIMNHLTNQIVEISVQLSNCVHKYESFLRFVNYLLSSLTKKKRKMRLDKLEHK